MVQTSKVFGCFVMPKRVRPNIVAPSPGGGISTIDGPQLYKTNIDIDMGCSTSTLVTNSMSSTTTLDIANVPQGTHAQPAMQARHSWLWHLLIDLPILLLVLAVCILLELGAVPSRRAGFLCHDPALSLPHLGDTFSISLIGFITLLVPFVVMWVVEMMLHQEDEYNLKKSRACASAKIAGLVYRDYLYGAIVNLTILEVVKCVVGSPRPSFFDLCKPDMEKTCNVSEYVSSYECTSTEFSSYLRIDSSRSFPSAHASLAVYCGLFLAWYLQRRAFSWRNRSVLLVPLVQVLCIIYAAVCSLTRVSDHRHHWWDVLAGAALGAVTVLYVVMVLLKNFNQPAVVSTSDLSSSDGNNHQSVRRLLSSAPHVVVP